MTLLGDIAGKVRSKNAGPFWLTIDIFCDTPEAFDRVRKGLTDAAVAARLGTDPRGLKRFEIADLCVVKFSFPRPHVQGTALDRDMHGAAHGALLAEMPVAP